MQSEAPVAAPEELPEAAGGTPAASRAGSLTGSTGGSADRPPLRLGTSAAAELARPGCGAGGAPDVEARTSPRGDEALGSPRPAAGPVGGGLGRSPGCPHWPFAPGCLAELSRPARGAGADRRASDSPASERDERAPPAGGDAGAQPPAAAREPGLSRRPASAPAAAARAASPEAARAAARRATEPSPARGSGAAAAAPEPREPAAAGHEGAGAALATLEPLNMPAAAPGALDTSSPAPGWTPERARPRSRADGICAAGGGGGGSGGSGSSAARRAPPPGAAAACHTPRARSPRASPRDSGRHVEALLAEAEAAVAASGGRGGRAGGAWRPEHRGDDDICRWRPARAVQAVGKSGRVQDQAVNKGAATPDALTRAYIPCGRS